MNDFLKKYMHKFVNKIFLKDSERFFKEIFDEESKEEFLRKK